MCSMTLSRPCSDSVTPAEVFRHPLSLAVLDEPPMRTDFFLVEDARFAVERCGETPASIRVCS